MHVPHGLGVALGTPLSLRFNAQECVEQYCEMAAFCGIVTGSAEERAERFVERIEGLLESAGLPRRIQPPADAPDDLIEVLVRNAFESTPVPITLNPRKIDEAIMREMFEKIVVSGEASRASHGPGR